MNNKNVFLRLLALLVLSLGSIDAHAQFMRSSGKQILDNQGEEFLIRSMGLGGWMLQEGYLMHTAGHYGTQHALRAKLEQELGKAKTDEFYDEWLANHCTRADIDSMKVWGFNTVRVAMHYKLFTLPIEEEPVVGQQTWLNKGFDMIDELLEWCEANEMYLILDMHGAPGGQGANADISDYDPSKPALWESDANKDKFVALWRKLADRYKDERWIGGYDLLNETNWTLPGNTDLMNLYKRTTTAIREVDNNHLIFIEGNAFANDFNGLTPPWDRNMAYSFHKYWSYNKPNSLDWVLWMRDAYNVPLWLGETGENSNTWFEQMVRLCEANDIGWSMWPLKKVGLNNPLRVHMNSDYEEYIQYLKGERSTSMTVEQKHQALMTFAQNHNIANCTIQYDVIDALFRQPKSATNIPFKNLNSESEIFFSDFDLGAQNVAYYDNDVANYHVNTGNFTAWNKGWGYRNDGVDIEQCSDLVSNGYSVGWLENNEWMKYTVELTQDGVYDLIIRNASEANGAHLLLEVDGVELMEMKFSGTGGWSSWKDKSFADIPLSKGIHELKFIAKEGGSNLNYFKLINHRPLSAVPSEIIQARALPKEKQLELTFNKQLNQDLTLDPDLWIVELEGNEVNIVSIGYSETQKLIIQLDSPIKGGQEISVSYTGNELMTSDGLTVETFTKYAVDNEEELIHYLPGIIEAEEFEVNNGFVMASCKDNGGGLAASYSDRDDYLDYKIDVAEEGFYELALRVASDYDDAGIIGVYTVDANGAEEHINDIVLEKTGGWEVWQTQKSTVRLPAGQYTLRLVVKEPTFNLNWMDFNYRSGEHFAVPGRIEAEYFYQNQGAEIERCQDLGGGYNLSYLDVNDFVDYKIVVSSSAYYEVTFRTASAYDNGGAMSLYTVDDNDNESPLGQIKFNSTGGWQEWKNHQTVVWLEEGSYTIRAKVMAKEFNLNWIELQQKSIRYALLPGKHEAENYFTAQGVNPERCYDAGGGQNLTDIDAGDYWDIPVEVEADGQYRFDYRIASPFTRSGKVQAQLINNLGQSNVIHEIEFGRTGAFQVYEDFSITSGIAQGQYILRFKVLEGGFNINYISVTKVGDTLGVPEQHIVTEIYPNPFQDELHIKFNPSLGDSARFKIVNANGTCVLEGSISKQNELSLNLEGLSAGWYICVVESENGKCVKKIIKQ